MSIFYRRSKIRIGIFFHIYSVAFSLYTMRRWMKRINKNKNVVYTGMVWLLTYWKNLNFILCSELKHIVLVPMDIMLQNKQNLEAWHVARHIHTDFLINT